MAKILITGSTGFIGKRLLYQVLEQGHEVYALSRIKGIDPNLVNNPNCHIFYGDLREQDGIPFPKDIDVAYYLIHSLGKSVQDLSAEEERVAHNFVQAIEQTGCKQIIFLGGIIENTDQLSPHLLSRLQVERILKASHIPCTVLRSSIIVGAGSASFEIIRDLVEKLPVMVAPKWVKSYCQPILVKDVIYYLCAVMLNQACFGQTYDIGGPEAITFKDVLLRYAAFRKLKRYILDIPLLTPRLSSYWLVFVTSVRFSICSYLVESMKQNTRKLNHAIDSILPHECLSYEEGLKLIFQLISQNAVVSTWMDAWNLKKIGGDIQDYIEVPKEGCLRDVKVIPITIPIEEVQKRIWSIGGDKGWYSLNWAWRLRGLIDQMVGGIGLNRGRRHPTKIEIGDSIDFWRVLQANEKKRHLILFAEMKVPGEAWLEFKIDEENKVLRQTATFRPKGFLGRLYWYFFFPFHLVIFRNMAKTLAQKRFFTQ